MILKGVIENEKCGHRISDGMRMEEKANSHSFTHQ